jgi:uncharacterized protein YunC (DUF1805 family)
VIEVKPVEINENTVIEVNIGNPEFPEKPVIIVLIAKEGLIVCRNFDIDVLNERNVTAARVKGLTKIEDALEAKIESCRSRAHVPGVTGGMMGKEALLKLQNE